MFMFVKRFKNGRDNSSKSSKGNLYRKEEGKKNLKKIGD